VCWGGGVGGQGKQYAIYCVGNITECLGTRAKIQAGHLCVWGVGGGGEELACVSVRG